MSQAKVDQYKQSKGDRKNWKKAQTRQRVRAIIISVACVAALVLILVAIFRPDYSNINTGSSKYDDAALSSIVGYQGITLTDAVSEDNGLGVDLN